MYSTKGEIIGIILVIIFVLSFKGPFHKEEAPKSEPVTTTQSELDAGLAETSLVNPFAPDTWLDSPDWGLTIGGGKPPCVDSYLRTEVSCADKEAILKYRNALQDAETQRLKLKIEKLQRELTYEEFGLQEC